ITPECLRERRGAPLSVTRALATGATAQACTQHRERAGRTREVRTGDVGVQDTVALLSPIPLQRWHGAGDGTDVMLKARDGGFRREGAMPTVRCELLE